MKNTSIGFIGGGALAGALIKGIAGKLVENPANIYVSDHKQERCDELHTAYGVTAAVGAEDFLS
ncbi:MAG: NAD(P)-binding domain-containing protein, partial [Selenomonadaceae bacterium]|nr:NAD(P)-binding domain-containing protein [Selenomonadaceae bacterium]